MDDFDGSYVLGLAGYNAGPGEPGSGSEKTAIRAIQTSIRSTGSNAFRSRETRDYVTKVLANIQIYRARLGDTKNALRLQQDLVRARGVVQDSGRQQ